MNGTLNANITSNNAAYAKIRALEKKLEALSSDVNANETEIEQVQTELDNYKTQLASDFNAKNLSVSDTLDVKGTTHIEGSFTADNGATVKNTLDTNRIRINSTDGMTTSTISPTLIQTQYVSASQVQATTGSFSDLKNVSSIDVKKATINTNNVTTENVTDLTAENVLINSDLKFPKVSSKISGEYLDIEANTIEADNLTAGKLDVGGINSTGSIVTSSTLSCSGDTYLNKLIVTNDIEALGDVTGETITAKDLKVSGSLSSETIDTQNLNVKDLNTTTNSVDIVPGSKLLIQENGQIKTAVIKDVTSSGLELNGYVPYNLDENVAQSQGYSLSDIEGTIISYSKDKLYTTKATYSLLNGQLVKDEDVLSNFNFVSVKDDIGLSFDTSTNTFSWVYIGLDGNTYNKGDILGSAKLDNTVIKYENGSFYRVNSKVTKAFKPVMVGNAIVFVDMAFSPYSSFYFTKDSKNYLSINNYQWQDIPAIDTADYGINYKTYITFGTYTTETVYTAVTLSRIVYNSSSSTINNKKWKYAEYGGYYKLNVLYEDDTWESVTLSNVLLELYYGAYVKDLGTDVVIYDFYNKKLSNYTVTELTEAGVKNSSYNWNSGYALESGTTVHDVTWYTSSKWSNKVTVTDSEFNVSIPTNLTKLSSDSIAAKAITADSINISDLSLEQATINNLNSTDLTTSAVTSKDISTDNLTVANNATFNSKLSLNEASIQNLEVENITSLSDNLIKVAPGGYVSLLGNSAAIDQVEANNVDISTYSFIEKPSLYEDGTITNVTGAENIFGSLYTVGTQLFKTTENGPQFVTTLPSSNYSSIEYHSNFCYLNFYTTQNSFTRIYLSPYGGYTKTEVSYPTGVWNEIRHAGSLIYTDNGTYIYANNKFFRVDNVTQKANFSKVIVDNNFLFFSNGSNASTNYHLCNSSSNIETISSFENVQGRVSLLKGWKFTLNETSYSPDLVSVYYNGSYYLYNMFNTSTGTVSSVNGGQVAPASVGIVEGSIYNELDTSKNFAFATSIWFYNNYGLFIDASNGVLSSVDTLQNNYLKASVPCRNYDGNLVFNYTDTNSYLYSQYKKEQLIRVDDTGIQTKNLMFGPIKFKYIDKDYWNEMKDLTILDIKGCYYLNTASNVTETVLSFDGQTSTEIKFTTGYLTNTSSVNKTTIDSTSTFETGKYYLIVEYFEA